MNKSIEASKTTQKTRTIIKQKQPEAYYKAKEEWKAINDGQTFCPHCKQIIREEEAMEGRDGNLLHEACHEPGE